MYMTISATENEMWKGTLEESPEDAEGEGASCTLHAGSAIDLRPIQTHTRPPRINIARIGTKSVGPFPHTLFFPPPFHADIG